MNSQFAILFEVFWVFLRLGASAFGGPAVHIAMMENEFVGRRQWLARERFLDLLGVAYLLPGPSSTELALFIGRERAGLPGLLAAGAGFILPAFAAVTLIAAFWTAGSSASGFESVVRGIQPVVIAVVAQALWSLSRAALRSPALYFCAALTAAGAFFNYNLIVLLLGAGMFNFFAVRSGKLVLAWPAWLIAIAVALYKPLTAPKSSSTAVSSAIPAAAGATVAMGVGAIFFTFLKIGALYYGGGYVLLSFLHDEFVLRLHVLNEQQVLAAIAVGQVTPGPLFTSATFVGYLLQGPWGGVAATAAIFGPAFLYAILSGPYVSRIRQSAGAGAFLDGVNAASCALMAVVSCQIGVKAIFDWKTALIALVSAVILIRFKLNAAWLVLAGALVGWLCL